MAGRPSKYTEERAAAIVTAIETGATYALAAAHAGVSADTLGRWRTRFADFAERIAVAEGRGALVNLGRIQQAAQEGDWRAAAWMLEHRYPHAYGRQAQQREGNAEASVTFTFIRDEPRAAE
jgi:transposase-like protein